MTTEKTQAEQLNDIGRNAFASICEMVAALECDRKRLEELREERDEYEPNDGPERLEQTEFATNAEQWAFDNSDDAEELVALESACRIDGEEVDEETARERIQEDALSVRVFGERTNGEWEADKFEVLLTTGGPAVRIIGELTDGEPTHAWLEVQDWGTPWTEYYETDIRDTLLSYCRCFYFGE